MKYWPVPDSYFKKIPAKGSPGSFWENRGDRFHCGIDIYAPAGSEVVSIDDGIVLESGIFTNPNVVSYWNETKFILIKNQDDVICKYAELEEVIIKTNEVIKAGQSIGYVGTVLNVEKIKSVSPKYIREIKNNKNLSMLHFEVYRSKPNVTNKYLGGNWFGNKKPRNLVDPTIFLLSTIRISAY